MALELTSFNPLTGIRSFLTRQYFAYVTDSYSGFNPLTGIRSFLTPSNFRGYGWETNSLNQIEGLVWSYICCDLLPFLYPLS